MLTWVVLLLKAYSYIKVYVRRYGVVELIVCLGRFINSLIIHNYLSAREKWDSEWRQQFTLQYRKMYQYFTFNF